MSVDLVAYKLVSDLEADHAQQQESREEGVEEDKVERESRQSSRISFIDDLIALSDYTGSRQRTGTICNNTTHRRRGVNLCGLKEGCSSQKSQ